MKQFLIVFLVFCFTISGFSQTKIYGTLSTEKGKAISGASITLTNLNSDDILNYDISDNKGFFSISINTKIEQFQLNIRSMGFKTVVKIIDNKTQTLNFVLEEEITELKEVVIKPNAITKRGDTLNYSVNAFTRQQDRTIADVLKNMPGIEVLSDGKILYQGKPINKYYIEGLDLLEGKYCKLPQIRTAYFSKISTKLLFLILLGLAPIELSFAYFTGGIFPKASCGL